MVAASESGFVTPARQFARHHKIGLGVAVVIAALTVGAGVAFSLQGNSSSPASAHNASVRKAQGVSVEVQPADGANGVMPNSPVVIRATSGHLVSVEVTTSDGKALPGLFDPVAGTWQSNSTLVPSTQYAVMIEALSPSDKPVQQLSHFVTMTPATTLGMTLFPDDGMTVGVGQAVLIHFDHAVTNKDAVLSHLHVTESTPVPGGWHWFSDRELHFRPQNYWPAGETINVTANLAGVDAGNGVWGTKDHTVQFATGDAHVATADVDSEQMTVTSNGKVVYTFPISGGRPKYPTMNGVHVVLYRQQDVLMDSQTVGIPRDSPDGYYEHVFEDVAITDGGEFVHAAPWSVGSQGRTNVSHGCINLSPANATTFFNFSRIGDVVQVVGSSRAPSSWDHGTMDWNVPWNQWTPAI